MAKKSSKVGSILLVLVLITGLSLVLKLTGGIDDIVNKVTSLNITYNNKTIDTNMDGIAVVFGAPNRFNVSKTGYKVKIVPNAANDFDFTLDGDFVRFSSLGDCGAAFNIEEQENYFTIAPAESANMQSILSKVYEGQSVELVSEIDLYEKDYFLLIITQDNKSISLGIRKHFTIKLDKSEIMF